MVLQMKDCANVLNDLHLKYDFFIFLFDHSCGHDRKRPDGLCSNSVQRNEKKATKDERNKDWIERVPRPNKCTLFLRMSAHTGYHSAEKELKRTKRPTGKTIERSWNKADLQKGFKATGVSAKGTKDDELQALCKNKNIPTIQEEINEVDKGWEAKGYAADSLGKRLYRSWKEKEIGLYIQREKGSVREHHTSVKSKAFDKSANRLHRGGNDAAIPREVTLHQNRRDSKVSSQDGWWERWIWLGLLEGLLSASPNVRKNI